MFKKSPLPILFILTICIYIPAFIFPYSVHNDGMLMLTPIGNLMGHIEAMDLFMEGRPVGAFLVSIIGWFMRKTEFLIFLRLVLFGLLLFCCRLFFVFFHKKLKIERFWSIILCFIFGFLPANIINVMWVSSGIAGFSGIVCGLLAYNFLQQTDTSINFLKNRDNRKTILQSVAIFLLGTFIYPSTTMIICVLIFAKLFLGNEAWDKRRKTIIFDIIAVGFFAFLYVFIIKVIIFPLSEQFLKIDFNNYYYGSYEFSVVKNFSGKFYLIFQTFLLSLSGTLDCLWGPKAAFGVAVIMVLLFIVTVSFLWARGQALPLKVFSQQLVLGVMLFFLANAPTFLAIRCFNIFGYRVLLPTTMIGAIAIVALLRAGYHAAPQRWLKLSMKGLTVLYCFLIAAIAALTIGDAVRNFHKEYVYLKQRADGIDYLKTERILIGVHAYYETVIERPLPYEMSFMTTLISHARRYFDDKTIALGKNLCFRGALPEGTFYLDEYTALVDLTDIRGPAFPSLPRRKRIFIKVHPQDNRRIFIDAHSKSDVSPIRFNERRSSGLTSYWQIPPGLTGGTADVYYLTSPKKLLWYKIHFENKSTYNTDVPLVCQILGLNEENQWVNLTIPNNSDTTLLKPAQAVFISDPKKYKAYRLVFSKPNPTEDTHIYWLQLNVID